MNKFKWGELITGLLLIALGIVTIIKPDSILTSAVVIYGIIVIVMGIEDLLMRLFLALCFCFL